MGLLECLCLILVVLKVAGLISLPWFWVLSPVIIPLIALAVVFILACILGKN